MREPDWKSLADLQFILYNRIAGSLNEALSGIALSDMPEAQDKPPGFWKDRATVKIANVLNLFTAWSYLIRYKMGEATPERAIRPFHANALLAWLGDQLQLNPPPQIESNPLLHANQETLQEALMLLYSVAFTQGAGVRLELESSRLGMWFRVKFSRTQPLPATVDELLASFGDHWRAQDTSFELATARDFIQLNGADLMLNSSSMHGEFMFFVRAAGAPKKKAPPPPRAETPPAQTKPLSPEALEQALEVTGENVDTGRAAALAHPQAGPPAPEAAPGDAGATPDTAEAAPTAETPVFTEMQVGKPPGKPPATPSVLNPLPPALSELQRQIAARDAADDAVVPDATEASGSVDEPGQPETSAAPPDAVDLQGVETLRLPEKPAGPAGDAPVIMTANIPGPSPPTRLSVPPAATSNSAVTRQTQPLTPDDPDSSPTPTGDQDNAQVPPDEPDSAPDSTSRKESS